SLRAKPHLETLGTRPWKHILVMKLSGSYALPFSFHKNLARLPRRVEGRTNFSLSSPVLSLQPLAFLGDEVGFIAHASLSEALQLRGRTVRAITPSVPERYQSDAKPEAIREMQNRKGGRQEGKQLPPRLQCRN